MGLYIKGMEMPVNCFLCQLSYIRENRLFCYQTKDEVVRAKIADNCPLVPVSAHGDLIDRAALLTKALPKNPDAQFHCVALKDIDMAPTIIPAEEETNERLH